MPGPGSTAPGTSPSTAATGGPGPGYIPTTTTQTTPKTYTATASDGKVFTSTVSQADADQKVAYYETTIIKPPSTPAPTVPTAPTAPSPGGVAVGGRARSAPATSQPTQGMITGRDGTQQWYSVAADGTTYYSTISQDDANTKAGLSNPQSAAGPTTPRTDITNAVGEDELQNIRDLYEAGNNAYQQALDAYNRTNGTALNIDQARTIASNQYATYKPPASPIPGMPVQPGVGIGTYEQYGQGTTGGVVTGPQGTIVVDLSSTVDALNRILNQNVPQFQTYKDFLANIGGGATQNNNQADELVKQASELAAKIQTGNTQQDYADALNQAANLMGLTPDQYQTVMGGLSQQLSQGVSGQQGMSDQELAARQREIANQTAMQQDRARLIVENMQAGSGSTSRALLAADEAMKGIYDKQLQSQMALADQVYQRKLGDFQGKMQVWTQMMNTGQITQAQYIDAVTKSQNVAVQAYAVAVDNMVKVNDQYLNAYNSEQAAVAKTVDAMNTAAATMVGVPAALISEMQSAVEFQLGGYYRDLQTYLQGEGMKQAKAGNDTSFITSLLGIIGGVVGTLIAPGAGTAAGAALGSGLGKVVTSSSQNRGAQ